MYKTSIKIPYDFSNVSELCNYVKLVYDVKIAPNPDNTSEVVIRTNAGSELEGAQNLALLFIGPESEKVFKLQSEVLKIFTIPTIRRYLARGFKLITTNIKDSSMSLRGSQVVVDFFSRALESANASTPNSFIDGDSTNLCRLRDIDVKQLTNTSERARFVLYKFIIELESLVNSYGSSIQNPNTLNQTTEPGYVEAFRKDSLQNQQSCIINVYTDSRAVKTNDKGTTKTRSSSSRRKSRHRSELSLPKANVRSTSVGLASLIEASPNRPSTARSKAAKRNSRIPQLQTNGQLMAPSKGSRRLRPVVIDGANVAHGESSNSTFNVFNLRCVVDYFVRRGHQEIAVVLPSDGQTPCNAVFSQSEINNYFIFTPIRRFDRSLKTQRTDDDSVILQYALEKDGVVISNDQYRDWLRERPEFRNIIENRVIPYSLRGGIFIISYYPLGKKKPPLDDILAFSN